MSCPQQAIPDKASVLRELEKVLTALVENAQKAADQAHESATHEESVAENKYDTLGLEASYLAHGQSIRAAQCVADLNALKNTCQQLAQLTPGHIGTGSLISLESSSKNQLNFLLLGFAGGTRLSIANHLVTVITSDSPVGKLLLNLDEGDELTLQNGELFEIIRVQ